MATKGAGASLPKTTSSHELTGPAVALLGSGKPDELTKAGIAAANAAGQAAFRELLQGSVEALSGAAVAASVPAGFVSKVAYDAADAVVRKAITNAVRLKAEGPEIFASLVAGGLQEPLAADVAMVVSKKADAIKEALAAEVPHHPKLESLRTRVDVTISASGVQKVMRPVVTMETRTSDGKVRTFEVPPEQLHQLRYSVAKVLNEMGTVEAHPVLKIA